MGTVTAERDALIHAFETYCRFGDSHGEATMTMSSRNFAKLFRDCALLDKQLTLTHLDLAFTKASNAPTTSTITAQKAGKRVDYPQWLFALQLCADYKGTTAAALQKAIAAQSEAGPTLSGTVAQPVKFHDDKSTYTVLLRGDASSKLIQRQGSVKLLPVAQMPAENSHVFVVFEQYALFGETVGTATLGLTSRNFVKLFKDLDLVDRKVTNTVLDLIFTKAARAPAGNLFAQPADAGGKRLNYSQFLVAVEMVAEEKGVKVQQLYKAIGAKQDQGPLVTATVAPPNKLFDDRSTWTAVARTEALDGTAARRASINNSAALVAQVRQMSVTREAELHAEQNAYLAAAQNAFERQPPPAPPTQVRPAMPVPREPANRAAMVDVFEAYARFGDTLAQGTAGMTSRNLQKMMKDAGIIDRKVTPTFLDLIFTKASRAPIHASQAGLDASWGGKRISFNQFLVACELIAEARSQISGELHSLLLLRCADGPSIQAQATVPSHNRFFDDRST